MFPKGKGSSHKKQFYNPIKQNASHIKHLKNLINIDTPMQSIIVFSDECTLKDVTINSDVRVVYRRDGSAEINQIYEAQANLLTQEEVNALHDKLHPYMRASVEKTNPKTQ